VPSGLNGEDPFAYRQTSLGALPHWQAANPGWSIEGILDYLKVPKKTIPMVILTYTYLVQLNTKIY